MRKNTKRVAGVLLICALFVSVGLNVFLFFRSMNEYRGMHRLRLDPTTSKRFTRANAEVPEVPANQPRIVFFGDSLIEKWKTLPEVPQAQLINRGCGRETTAQLLLRIERDVLALSPSVAVIQAGTNDLRAIGVLKERAGEIQRQCVDNLKELKDRLRAKGIDVVLLTLFPPGPVDFALRLVWSPAIEQAFAAVNNELRSLAGPGVTVLDCDPILKQEGKIKAGFSRDTFHINSTAYEALNGELAPVLEGLTSQK